LDKGVRGEEDLKGGKKELRGEDILELLLV
jgi:hypothetical protein